MVKKLLALVLVVSSLFAVDPSQGVLNEQKALEILNKKCGHSYKSVFYVDKIECRNKGLSDKDVKDMFSGLTYPDKLTYLSLYDNKLKEIPDISKLTKLTHLSLSFNQLKELPDISKLTKLTTLRLSNNELTTIDENWSKLTNLRYWNLSGNKFKGPIPKSVLELQKRNNLKPIVLE
jgi:Leucine-rich repeat (LRR) protein